jgi:hypothetical protein
MINRHIIELYTQGNKKLFPLRKNSKKPVKEATDWVTKKFSKDSIYNHKGNLAWAIDANYLVVDIDPKKGGEASLEKLLYYIHRFDKEFAFEPCVVTPSGGHHYYLKLKHINEEVSLKKNVKEYPGIDFLSYGQYCVIPGSIIKEYGTESYTFYDPLEEMLEYDVPKSLIKLLAYEVSAPKNDLGDFEGLIGGGKYSNWSVKKVEQMLYKLDPSVDHDTWVDIGMSLHSWDPIEGFELWDEWSKQSDKYEEGLCESKWKGFNVGGGITLGTVNYMVKEVMFYEEHDKVNNYIERIKYADEKVIQFDIVSAIRKEDFDKINREKLVKAIQSRLKEITGVRMSVAAIRSLVQKHDIVTGQFVEDMEQPEWCKRWIYINSHNCYMDLDNLQMHKSESFNLQNGIYVPCNQAGSKISATKYVSDNGFIKKIDAIAYLPTFSDLICEIDGTLLLNSFNPRTIPVEALEYTEKGLETITMMENHIRMICGSDEIAHIFIQWLAHNVQFPGKQIGWSILVQSIQGMGKSYIGEVMRQCLGDKNVGTVSPTQVTSSFNGWATGVCLNILEELHVKGHNRYECLNAVKPLITDRTIQVNEKNIRAYTTYNTTNYLSFTNRRDAIPLQKDDRRFMVIFCELESLNEIDAIVGMPHRDYFPKLFDMTAQYSDEIRKYFLEYPITKEFLNTKQAPASEFKDMMISTEDDSIEGLNEVKELLKRGGHNYNSMVVSASDLFKDLMLEYPDVHVTYKQRNYILKELGYNLMKDQMKLDGIYKKIWSKRTVNQDDVTRMIGTKGEYLEDI